PESSDGLAAEREQHRRAGRSELAPRAAVDEVAGPERSTAHERRDLSFCQESARRRSPAEASRRRAARSVGSGGSERIGSFIDWLLLLTIAVRDHYYRTKRDQPTTGKSPAVAGGFRSRSF